MILVGIVYQTGLFEWATTKYEDRVTEETGREILWPAAIERIFSSPATFLFGVGESRVGMNVLRQREMTGPHNAFLHFMLSAGVIPFAFFLAFFIQAAWRSVHAKGQEGDTFRAPYLVYVFVILNSADGPFLQFYAIISLSVAAGSAVVHGKQRLLGLRVGNKIRFGLPKPPEPSTLARPR